MSWNNNDIAFKTLINKRATDSSKNYYEEFGDNTINTYYEEIWSSKINSDPSISIIDGAIKYYNSLKLLTDPTVQNTLTYIAVTNPSISYDFSMPDDPSNPRLKEWVSDKFGEDYLIDVYSIGTQISPTNNVYPWFFDYMTGILTFNSSSPAQPITVSGYRYIGSKGIGSESSINVSNGLQILADGCIGLGGDITEKTILTKTNFDISSGLDEAVFSIALDPSGYVYTGGYFRNYQGNTQNYLIRLNNDGTKDNSFDIGSGFDNFIVSITLDPSGYVYAGGYFTNYQGNTQNYLIRLNNDGTKDNSFDIGSGFDSDVLSIALDPSGYVYVGGNFTNYKGNPQNYLIRLNNDGTKDNSFDIGSGFDAAILSIVLDSSGYVYIGGAFLNYQGNSQNLLIRLNNDATKDNGFDIGSGFDGDVESMILDPTNHLYVAGNFTTYKSNPQNYLVRLNNDGAVDTSFDIGTGFDNQIISLDLDSNGYIYAGGFFINYQNTPQNYIISLNNDGTVNTIFDISSGFDSYVYAIKYFSGYLYIGGQFMNYQGNPQSYITRLDNEGILEKKIEIIIDSFGLSYGNDYSLMNIDNPRWIPDKDYVDTNKINVANGLQILNDGCIGLGGELIQETSLEKKETINIFDISSGLNGYVRTMVIDSSNYIYVGGGFTYYQGRSYNNLMKINDKGVNDLTFNIGSGFSGGAEVTCIKLDSSGYIYVGGDFTSYQDSSQNYLIRLNNDGAKDNSFDIGSGFNAQIRSINLDSSGYIYIGGAFISYQDSSQNYLIRLNNDGTKDDRFDIGSGFNFNLVSTQIDSSGYIYAGGNFTSYQDSSQNYLIRLNNDGTKDDRFDIGSGFIRSGGNNFIDSILLDSSDNLYVIGSFISYQDSSQNNLIRLNNNGAKDDSFDIGSGFGFFPNYSEPLFIFLDPSNHVYIGGAFISYQDSSQNYLIRLNNDGTKDDSFDIGSGFNSYIFSICLDHNGYIYTGGTFTNYQNTPQNYIVKLRDDASNASIINLDMKLSISSLGMSYEDDYSSLNIDNPRWIPDKSYVDNNYYIAYKYKGVFDGSSGSNPLLIDASTHLLGEGPFNISVFDSGISVKPNIYIDNVGDISISWIPGSLSNNCSFIIIG